MSDVLPQLFLVVVLVLVNAAFAGTELALVSLREGQLQRLEAASNTGAVLARLARRPNQYLATIQIGITLAGFLASAAAAVSLAEPLEPALDFLGGAARPASIMVITLLLSYLTLVFGELAPKRLAMQRAERWSMVMARPLATASRLTRPVVWLLSKSTDLVVKILGGDPDQQRAEVTEDELRDMVKAQETFTAHQRRIIDGAFLLTERTVGDVLRPRNDVFVLDPDWACDEALDALAASGHTRAPVATDRTLDRTTGVVHLRQLLAGGQAPVSTVMVDIPAFPDAARALTAVRRLQLVRAQMAVVVNERGTAVGIVTMEDLVEELVGEIWDETDPHLATVQREGDHTVVVPGRTPIQELVDLGIEVPTGSYATVAGFFLLRFGRFPQVGDTVESGGRTFQVRAIDRHAVATIAITTTNPPTTNPPTTNPPTTNPPTANRPVRPD